MSDRPDWFSRPIISPLGQHDAQTIKLAQLLVRVPQTGVMDGATVSALRGIQRMFNLPVSGALDLETARALDSLRWVE